MPFSDNKIRLGIVLFSMLIFVPFLGSVHLFDWDEINFAEAAREMVLTGNYSLVQIDYRIFFEKPPLFLWIQAVSMHVFGINEFAARFPNAIIGVISLLFVYNIGKRYYDRLFGVVWVLSYAGSILPFFYFKSGIIDPLFNLFIFSGIYYAFRYLDKTEKEKRINLIWSGLAIGLGILTKGPVALLLYLLTFGVYFLLKRFKGFPSIIDFTIVFAIMLLSGGSWFIVEFIRGNENVIYEFIQVQIDLLTKDVATHGQPWYYHPMVLLIGVFPASVLAIRSFGRKGPDSAKQYHLSFILQILFWVVLIVFSSVKTKIVHYSSMTYFSLTFLAAHTVYYLIKGEMKWKKWMSYSLVLIGSFWGILISIFPIVGLNMNKLRNSNIISDEFALGNMEALVDWSGYEGLIGLLLLLVLVFVIRRKEMNIGYRMIVLNVTIIITMFVFTAVNVPKIEKYTQNAAIEFFEKFKDDSAYVAPLHYVTYAYLFYSDKKPQANPNHNDIKWLLNGDIDKPAYFISRNNNKVEILSKYDNIEVIGEKNGFVFYKRKEK